jgi:hypothetical protein
MIQDRVRTSAPSHWHIFREVAPGVKQYMLPLYHYPAQALAAVPRSRRAPIGSTTSKRARTHTVIRNEGMTSTALSGVPVAMVNGER